MNNEPISMGASIIAAQKRAVGRHAARLVEDQMVVGLGTGSTASCFVEALARRVRAEALRLKGVATSVPTARLAARLGIEVIELPRSGVDLAVDGADEVDPELRLVKGRGGAHVHERIVATAAQRFVVIVDSTKLVQKLHGPLPVELLTFGLTRTLVVIEHEIAKVRLRLGANGEPRMSLDGNVLGDVMVDDLSEPEQLAVRLRQIPGVVDHGLFLELAGLVLVGEEDHVRELSSATGVADSSLEAR